MMSRSQSLSHDSITLTPIAIAVFNLASSPNLTEPPFLSFTKIKGTFLEEAMLGRCFVSHRGLQSEASSMAYILEINQTHQFSVY